MYHKNYKGDSVLSAVEIKRQMKKGNIIIDPFNEDNLQPNSYDITLGRYYYHVDTLNGWKLQDGGLFGKIHIPPNSVILAHSEEVFGTKDKFVAQIATKSTLARHGLDICGSAGFGDVGFVNKWTLEISNNTKNKLILDVGRGVGQVFFTKLDGDIESKYEGVYNSRPGDIWKPEDMLPKKL